MAAVATLPKTEWNQYLILPKDNRQTIGKKINGAVVELLRQLTTNYEEKLEASKTFVGMTKEELGLKKKLLKTGPWYPGDFYKRCQELGSKVLINHLKKGEHFTRGYMNPQQFSLKGPKEPEDEAHKVFYFEAKEGHDPFELAMGVSKSFSIIDCGNMVIVARYQALAVCLGEKRFNFAFSNRGLGRMNFSSRVTIPFQPLHYLLKSIDPTAKSSPGFRPVKLGDVCYFMGHPKYDLKHVYGCSVGFNVICTDAAKGNQRFTAFGLPLDLSEKELCQHLLDAYNSPSEQWYRKLPSDEEQKQDQKKNFKRDLLSISPPYSTSATLDQILGYNDQFGTTFRAQYIEVYAQKNEGVILGFQTILKSSK